MSYKFLSVILLISWVWKLQPVYKKTATFFPRQDANHDDLDNNSLPSQENSSSSEGFVHGN